LAKALDWTALFSAEPQVYEAWMGDRVFRSGMYASVATGTGGKTVIKLGVGETVEIEVQGAWKTEAEPVVCPFPFSSSEMRILSWNPTSISGTTSAGGADCFESVADVWAGASTSLSDGSTSACLGRRTSLALVLLSSSVVSEDSSKSMRSCVKLRSVPSASLARFCVSSRLKSAVVITDVSGIGASIGVAAADERPSADVEAVKRAFPFPAKAEEPLTLGRLSTGPNVGL